MYSKVYSGVIKFCQNNQDCFITDQIDQKLHDKSTKPINQGHPSAGKYLKAVQKLFQQITIAESNLWIIPTIGTHSLRIYFSDPIIYPVSTCCEKCVYIDIDTSLNGSIICPACNMVLASFIHYDDSNNEFGDSEQIDKHALFRERNRQNEMKNRLMYENLTSNKFKTKNLKKVLINYSNKTLKPTNTADSFNLSKSLSKPTKQGFILQIKAAAIKQIKHQQQQQAFRARNWTHKEATSASKYEAETKKEFDHQLSIEETRKIILDIFR